MSGFLGQPQRLVEPPLRVHSLGQDDGGGGTPSAFAHGAKCVIPGCQALLGRDGITRDQLDLGALGRMHGPLEFRPGRGEDGLAPPDSRPGVSEPADVAVQHRWGTYRG